MFKSSAVCLKENLYSVFSLHKDCSSALLPPIIKGSAIELICAVQVDKSYFLNVLLKLKCFFVSFV
ncbi:hypothetical protein FM106_16795 [Brachybacterium faecium]|nr:hypothetical protein FM106_16795 [Brachybacterium faecium]